jgi:hypothetical protein
MAKNSTKTSAKAKAKTAVPKTKNQSAKPQHTAQKDQDEPRQVKQSAYRSFSLQKRIKRKGPQLPTGMQLFGKSLSVLRGSWKLFLGLSLVYGILNVIFIQGLGAANNVESTKETFDALFTGSFGHIFSGLASYASLVATSGQSSSTSTGSYQGMWILLVSLATIWALRETFAERSVRVRDAFYKGMYPLVPVVLVLSVIALEFIPFVAGGTLFSTVIANGIAATSVELCIWAVLFFCLSVLSIYMVSSTMFAIYIACQPEVTPMQALHSTKQLVANRRFAIIRKVLFLPFILAIVNAIILLPFILIYAPAALWVFYIISMFNVIVIHSYYYTLYRSLLV